jgi:alpha-N-arabinofuranosidase
MPSWNEKGSATQFNENQWYNQIDVALKIEDRINKNSAIMDQYDADKLVGLIVDEWGSWYEVEKGTNPGFLYQQNTLRDALIAGLSLNIFNNHCDRVKMANIAQIINVLQSMILTKNDKIVLTPSYYVFKMYKVHQGAIMIPLTMLNTARYTKENMNMPLLNGSASIDSLGTINITLCNLDAENEQALQVELNQKDLKNISGEIITGDKINSINDFGKPEEVTLKEFSGFTRKNNAIELKLPPKSVVLIKIKSEIKNH